MPELLPAKPREVMRTIERLGFELLRQSGSHAVYKHPDGRWTTVPVHHGKDVSKGTLRRILIDVGLTIDEFSELAR